MLAVLPTIAFGGSPHIRVPLPQGSSTHPVSLDLSEFPLVVRNFVGQMAEAQIRLVICPVAANGG